MSITVKFQNEVRQERKPSEMPKLVPFVAKRISSGNKTVMITFPNNTVLFFESYLNVKVDWDDTKNFAWIDEEYEALPNEKATVILEV